MRPGAHRPHRLETAYDAVLFDMDGVVTNTAVLHAAAWKRLFDDVLRDPRAHVQDPQNLFDPVKDYRRYVDGRSREDGVAAYLGARGVELSAGRSDDPPSAWTIAGLAARKNELFLEELRTRELRVYPGTSALLRRLREGAVPVGLVTASRNAQQLLEAAGLADAFDTVVDGVTAAEHRLRGKPHPDMFTEAARRLGVAAARTAIVEDSVAGVEAGRAGGFGFVVGIDRAGQRAELEAAGAHIVLSDVGELDLGASTADPWQLVYDGFDPAHEGHREVLTALGSGYLVTRGVRPEHHDDGIHYPGTYLAGVYNRLTSTIHERALEEEHLVNTPNWLHVDLRIEDGPWLSSGLLPTQRERRELDLRRGLVTRRAILTSPDGNRLELVQRSFVSMDEPHLAVLETIITAPDWSGTVTLRAGVDAGVRNSNVAAYVGSDAAHLTAPVFRDVDDVTVCEVQTRQSRIRIATAVRTCLAGAADATARSSGTSSRASRDFRVHLQQGRPVTLTKTAAVFTSRDRAISEPGAAALGLLAERAGDVAVLLERHEAAWRRLWRPFGVTLGADAHSQLVLNLHVFHLLQTLSPHTAGLDAGVPARGLHGEGYRGHVFWDEVFALPVLDTRLPEVSRALIDYRWRRLHAARTAAAASGLAGALFPWQSGSDGREETPAALYNPRSGRWMPDNSHRQRHVGLAIAHNAWRHYQATGDLEWLAERGGELIIEVTRLFASLAVHDATTDRFHIAGVMGPDEFHDGPADAPGQGLRDNTYTNVLASWVAMRAGDVLALLEGHRSEGLRDRLAVTDDEIAQWARLSTRLAVVFHDDGVLSQFDGYEGLQELPWDRYRDQYGNIGRLDLILEAEDDSTNRYKLAKQPDVVMLVYLLGRDGVREQLAALGYPFSEADLIRTVDYYLARTADGSTLSRVVNASVLAGIDPARSWIAFREALIADLDDSQGGTTREGIHLGAMAGTVDLPVRSFAGMTVGVDELVFAPRLPPHLTRVAFRLRYRGHLIEVTLSGSSLALRAGPTTAPAFRVRVGDDSRRLCGGETQVFALRAPDVRPAVLATESR
ncbi:beta-phosphoglucomutase family hydrolase [Agrococcus sp. HG114]|uniref:beta-phosphoglucomutase family hydrolase n=1 Tax=Agrococcus sp. HG114 TaxID=2969757 RepID=UPI00215B1F1C|nr:beta-phosphoglucomutase family hydrolase [Agrococcus sp. HG114]MCR8670237.1 beta-phosphoglucomutase family hydrolase [Agrococcus sp. HG114]